ncbi:MAG: hypothetical protein SynsKO_15530 [Synoicihabitans sp.]
MAAPQSTKTRSISGRISEQDFDFLISYQIEGKVTVSEKLRHVASFFRRYHESFSNYPEALSETHRLIEPTRLALKSFEREQGIRSEVLDQVFQILPNLLAEITASREALVKTSGDEKRIEAITLEENVLQNMLQLLESLLRLAMTSKSPCYNPALLEGRLDTITELVGIAQQQQSTSTRTP